jgi:hypothetical protein
MANNIKGLLALTALSLAILAAGNTAADATTSHTTTVTVASVSGGTVPPTDGGTDW